MLTECFTAILTCRFRLIDKMYKIVIFVFSERGFCDISSKSAVLTLSRPRYITHTLMFVIVCVYRGRPRTVAGTSLKMNFPVYSQLWSSITVMSICLYFRYLIKYYNMLILHLPFSRQPLGGVS